MAAGERVRAWEQTLVVAEIVREPAAGRLVGGGEAVLERGEGSELGIHQLAQQSRGRDRVGRARGYRGRSDPDDRALIRDDVAQLRLPARSPHGGSAPRVVDANLSGEDGRDEVVAVVAHDAWTLSCEQGARGAEGGLEVSFGAWPLAISAAPTTSRTSSSMPTRRPGGASNRSSQELARSKRVG